MRISQKDKEFDHVHSNQKTDTNSACDGYMGSGCEPTRNPKVVIEPRTYGGGSKHGRSKIPIKTAFVTRTVAST